MLGRQTVPQIPGRGGDGPLLCSPSGSCFLLLLPPILLPFAPEPLRWGSAIGALVFGEAWDHPFWEHPPCLLKVNPCDFDPKDASAPLAVVIQADAPLQVPLALRLKLDVGKAAAAGRVLAGAIRQLDRDELAGRDRSKGSAKERHQVNAATEKGAFPGSPSLETVGNKLDSDVLCESSDEQAHHDRKSDTPWWETELERIVAAGWSLCTSGHTYLVVRIIYRMFPFDSSKIPRRFQQTVFFF